MVTCRAFNASYHEPGAVISAPELQTVCEEVVLNVAILLCHHIQVSLNSKESTQIFVGKSEALSVST